MAKRPEGYWIEESVGKALRHHAVEVRRPLSRMVEEAILEYLQRNGARIPDGNGNVR